MLNTFWITSRWTVISFLFGAIILSAFFPNFYWDSELFHVLIEGGGSLIGFGLALVMLAMIQKEQLTKNYVWLIAGFISMGTLDLFHSQMHPGQVFVWLHSVATLIGGIFSAMIWLPESLSKKFFKPVYLWGVLLLSICFSVSSILWPELIFVMLDKNKQFTLSADILNISGGIGFLAAWFYFAREYHLHQSNQSFYFSNHFCLFGIAGLLFEVSVLWDGNWWFWHMMRAFAYFLLMFHFSSIYRKSLLTKIDQSNQILNQTLNEIYMFDMNTFHFTEANLGAQKNLGYSLTELNSMTLVDLIPEMTKADFLKQVAPLISGTNKLVVFRTVLQRKNGSLYPVEVHLSLTNHEPILFFAIIIDITQIKESENERIRLQNELQQSQKMESLGQLTGGIAHDFNNLLGIINGYTELTIEHLANKKDEAIQSYVQNIQIAGNRAKDLVAQMLTFSRSSEVEDVPLNLSVFIKDNLKMLRSSLPSTIDIVTDIKQQLPEVAMDKTQLHQILMNLAVNARDAMDGTGKLTIRLKLNHEMNTEASVSHKPIKGDWVELSISDTGTGIKPEILSNIFNPFFTTKEVGKGTGLGLSVIYRIMENHGGHILLDSESGKGTTFRILFSPIVSKDQISSEFTKVSNDRPKGDGSEILIVDDEEMLAVHLSELLYHYEYKPHYVTDSTEALKIFRKNPQRFSILITDQTMPKLTGIELIDELRTIRPGLPVIMCSGFSDKIDAKIASELNISYIPKPINTEFLLREIATLR